MLKFHSNIENVLEKINAKRVQNTPITNNTQSKKVFANSGTIFTQPQFYSPLHTPQNWQIPSKRREIYQWQRYFTETEPKVGAAIEFYCFPPETKVLLADGTQQSIDEIKIGSLVRSHDGSANKVIRKFEREIKENILKIHIGGISVVPLRCTKGHKILVDRNKTIDYVKAEELTTSDHLLTPINYENGNRSYISGEYPDKLLAFIKGDYISRKIIKIEEEYYDGTVWDMEVENKHSYVAHEVAVSNSSFCLNGFELECKDSRIKRYFDNWNKKVGLHAICKEISHEFFMLGEAFPFAEISCKFCNGSGLMRDGKVCNHPGGDIARIIVMNPDSIEVQKSILAKDPLITFIPDEALKKTIFTKKPFEVYQAIPPNIRQMILEGQPIPLRKECISHLKHNASPYGEYGTSMIKRLFKMLTYKDKLMTAQWTVADRLILPIRVIKIGTDTRPANESDIADMQEQLAQTANDPNLTLVTHHAFEADWIGASGKVLTLSNEFEMINKEVLQGLMINEALLSGEAASYSSAAIGAEALIQRLESWRKDLSTWIETRLYEPIAKMKGWKDEEESKSIEEDVWIHPTIKWNDLNLRDDTQQKNLYMQLYDKQVISMQTLLEKFGMDYNHEVERQRYESALQETKPDASGGMGGDMGGGGMDMGGGGGGPPPDAGGEMGGGEMGAPPPTDGLGDAGMGGTDMGSAAPVGGGEAAASMGGSNGKIMTKKKATKNQKVMAEEVASPTRKRLTTLEQAMYKVLLPMRIPFKKMVQFPLGPYRADFAIPELKLAIECDGDQWHKLPDDMARDAKKDMTLARFGWTTVRYDETSLKEKIQEVQKSLVAVINKLWTDKAKKAKEQKNAPKVASFKESVIKMGVFNTQDEIEDGFLLAEVAEKIRIITSSFEIPGIEERTDESGFIYTCSSNWAEYINKDSLKKIEKESFLTYTENKELEEK